MTNSYEPLNNDPIPELVFANETAGLAIARNTERFASIGADMVMGNLSVICDRLQAHEYNSLSQETRGRVSAVTNIANDVAPMSDKDRERLQDENDQEYEYRIGVSGPIRALERKIHRLDFDQDDKLEMSKLRLSVRAAGSAFGAVLNEAQNLTEISRMIAYFQGNTKVAVKSASAQKVSA